MRMHTALPGIASEFTLCHFLHIFVFMKLAAFKESGQISNGVFKFRLIVAGAPLPRLPQMPINNKARPQGHLHYGLKCTRPSRVDDNFSAGMLSLGRDGQNDLAIEDGGYHNVNPKTDGQNDDVVVYSGKRAGRRSVKERAVDNADKVASQLLTTRAVANLERIRETLEKETGKISSMSCWANAAGVDIKDLQKQLQFGWFCQDELLRTTNSLVRFLSKKYQCSGLPMEDLVQAGAVGVLQGVERFDPKRGFTLSTYIHYWIRKLMSSVVARNSRGIQIPWSLTKAMNQIQKARKVLNNGSSRYSDDDIAKATGLPLAKVRLVNNCLRVVGSIDQKRSDGLNVKYMKFAADTSIQSPEETVKRKLMKIDIFNLLVRVGIKGEAGPGYAIRTCRFPTQNLQQAKEAKVHTKKATVTRNHDELFISQSSTFRAKNSVQFHTQTHQPTASSLFCRANSRVSPFLRTRRMYSEFREIVVFMVDLVLLFPIEFANSTANPYRNL
ncbi:RNA polymerase sigma factor sigC, partial [Cucurbita argyrosperma subsp. sororia]